MNDRTKFDWLVISALFMFPVTFLTVRHGVHVSLFALLLIATYQLWRVGIGHIQLDYSQDLSILFIFSGLFISVLMSQISRGQIDLTSFDGPSRLLLAGFVYIFLKQLNLPYMRILSVAISVGLICVFVVIAINPLDPKWLGRYSTYFVDPNSLGSQTLVLGLICILSIRSTLQESKWLMLLKLSGGILGIYVSVGSGSRGAWLAGPFILLLAFVFRLHDISFGPVDQKKKMWRQTFFVMAVTFAVIATSFYFSSYLAERIIVGYHDVVDWFSGSNPDGSAGIRLSIWRFSFQLANESLLFGYGEEKIMMLIMQNSPLNIPVNQAAIKTMALAGPHSDILSKLLSAGIFGLFFYLCLLVGPSIIFWRHRNSVNLDIKMASRVGLYYVIGIFIAGLSNEQLSLKYLCTFYGLMTAALMAQILYKPSAREKSHQSSIV